MSRHQQKRLAAYRELYTAVCSLSDSLFEEALTLCEDDRDAAFAASCALVAKLEHSRARSHRRHLLGRIDDMPRAAGKRHRSPASARP